MIPFDFIYCRPQTLTEAYEAFLQFQAEGKKPVYYAGGSEIIAMCRAKSIMPGAVIDIKQIPQCRPLALDQESLTLGAACTLNEVKESKLFPLLSLCCGRIADHTNQCKITLGGNLCGTIIYREASLPLLLSDASVTLLGNRGLSTIAFESVFSGSMQVNTGELIVQLHVPKWALQAPHFHVKRTAQEKIDYPLLSMAALSKDHAWRVAFSGVCPYPFRSTEMEAALNDRSVSIPERVKKALGLLPEPAYHDAKGSREYRMFVLENTLKAFLEEVDHGQA